MKPSRFSQSTAALLGGAVCLAILGGMIVGHAWPLWTGQDVLLRVVPLDRRDAFRGELVRLDTPAATLAVDSIPGPKSEAIAVASTGEWWASLPPDRDNRRRTLRGRTVYVQLEQKGPGGDYVPVSISRERVDKATNLRGRIQDVKEPGLVLRVNYGLDSYFTQEGRLNVLEEARREGRMVQMQVAIASSGRARIRNLLVDGSRW